MRREWLHLSWVEVGLGIRGLTALITYKRRVPSGKVVYPRPGHKCTEPRFKFYLAGDELRLSVPSRSERRLRRFLRDFVRHVGGSHWSISYWSTPWR